MPGAPQAKRLLRLLWRAWFPLLLLFGGLFWFWDSTHHDHDGPHGVPMPVAQIETVSLGTFEVEDGSTTVVTNAACRGGEKGDGDAGTFTHALCTITFENGDTDQVVVHLLPDGIEFRSTEG